MIRRATIVGKAFSPERFGHVESFIREEPNAWTPGGQNLDWPFLGDESNAILYRGGRSEPRCVQSSE